MLKRDILKPVLPEIEPGRISDLEALIAAEGRALVEPDALRRLAALLPRNTDIVEDIAGRLRLSNKARKRLGCAASGELPSTPHALAYRVGKDCAIDRLLLAGKSVDAADISKWTAPRLPVSGGALIERGLPEGPIVAQTLRRIEDCWVEAGFPRGEEFQHIVQTALDSASKQTRDT
jgi:poly(A) polymerase